MYQIENTQMFNSMRHPWPPLPLTIHPAAPDDPSHAAALDLRPLPTAPHSRLLLMPLPPLVPLALLRPADVLAPARSRRRPTHAEPNVLTRRLSSRCRSRSCCLLRGCSLLRCYRCSSTAPSQASTCPPQVTPSLLPCLLLKFLHRRPAARSLSLGNIYDG